VRSLLSFSTCRRRGIATDNTMTLYSHMFMLVLITDDAHMDLMRWNTAAAFPSLQLTSV